MADKPTEPHSLEAATNPAEPPTPAPTGAEALQRAMEKERDQALVMVRQTRARLETIAADADLPTEQRSMLDRAQSDLAAAEARCLGQSPSFLSITDLAATIGAVERLASSINRDLAAARDRANSPEARLQRAQASLEAMHHDLFEKKILDPYLRFENEQEEEEYRKRERERKEEIERLQKIGTPDALEKIAAIHQDQLQDAGQHGATASPDFQRLIQQQQQIRSDLQESTATANRSNDKEVDEVAALLKEAGVVSTSEDKPEPPVSSAIAQAQLRNRSGLA